MSKFVFRHDSDGYFALMQSDGVQNYLAEIAQNAIDGLSGAYSISKWTGIHRCNVSIYSTDWATYNDNVKNDTVFKACQPARRGSK